MKPVYVIHPYKGKKGEYENNMAKINELCRELSKSAPEIIPIAPILAFSFLDDKDDDEREKAINYCSELLLAVGRAGGEAWYFGDWENSKGCLHEMDLARRNGVPLKNGLHQGYGKGLKKS